MSARKRIVVVGAAGQARETAALIDDLATAGEFIEVLGFVVSDLGRLGPRDSRERVLGDYSWLERNLAGVDGLALGIGSPAARGRVALELEKRFPRLAWPSLVHPTVVLERKSLQVGRGAMIAPGVVGTVNVTIEPFAMVNFGATLGHEARVGAGSVVNPGANISGAVSIGAGALVGAGAVVLQYLSVGDGATVGAGAVVTHDVPPGVTVVGVPARPLVRAPT